MCAEDDPAVVCPLGITLGYLKGVLPDGVAAAWVGAIVRRAGRLYINRLLALAAMQEQQRGCEGVHTLVLPIWAIDRLRGGMHTVGAVQQG